jgi:hypothetical protein
MICSGDIVHRSDGSPIEVYGIERDNTEGKRAEERQLLLAKLDHRMRDALAHLDVIVERSRATRELSGCPGVRDGRPPRRSGSVLEPPSPSNMARRWPRKSTSVRRGL